MKTIDSKTKFDKWMNKRKKFCHVKELKIENFTHKRTLTDKWTPETEKQILTSERTPERNIVT